MQAKRGPNFVLKQFFHIVVKRIWLVALCFVIALAVMVVGGESAPWSKQSRYSVVFRHASGLRVGAPVRMAGVEIGMVTEIDLPTDPGQVAAAAQ